VASAPGTPRASAFESWSFPVIAGHVGLSALPRNTKIFSFTLTGRLPRMVLVRPGEALADGTTDTNRGSAGLSDRSPESPRKLLSAPGRNRTCDSRFRKPLLYPLSYEGLRTLPSDRTSGNLRPPG
jgi:hypothetical protein